MPLVFVAESVRRIRAERRGPAQRSVRGIEIHEVPAFGPHGGLVKRGLAYFHGAIRQDARDAPQSSDVDDARGRIPSGRHVELAGLVEAKQAVVAGAVQVNHHRGKVHGITVRASASRAPLPARRVEPSVADFVVVIAPAAGMLAREDREPLDDRLERIAHAEVRANQVAVLIRQCCRLTGETSLIEEIEENGAASQKRLEVAAEGLRIKTSELWEELPFASGPLEKRTGILIEPAHREDCIVALNLIAEFGWCESIL